MVGVPGGMHTLWALLTTLFAFRVLAAVFRPERRLFTTSHLKKRASRALTGLMAILRSEIIT